MVNKRKREEWSDSDSEEVTPGKQTLPVANLPYDFDQEPQDGMQYLFLVRRDARRLPRVTRAPNPYEVSETGVTHTPAFSSTNVLPCEQWRIVFQAHFDHLRKNLAQTIVHTEHDHSSLERMMPEKRDRDAWWKFLAGHPETAWSPRDRSIRKNVAAGLLHRTRAFAPSAAAVFSVPEQSGNGSSQIPCLPRNASRQAGSPVLTRNVGSVSAADISLSPKAAQDDGIAKLSPQVTPSHLREIDHRMSIHLLMYFTHWMNIHLQNPNDPLTAILISHGQWIFALLTKVEDRLSADEMNIMRNLARACLGLIRQHRGEHARDRGVSGSDPGPTPTTRMSDASCWIIFAAVAGYWGQRDLWADAEAMLTSS